VLPLVPGSWFDPAEISCDIILVLTDSSHSSNIIYLDGDPEQMFVKYNVHCYVLRYLLSISVKYIGVGKERESIIQVY